MDSAQSLPPSFRVPRTSELLTMHWLRSLDFPDREFVSKKIMVRDFAANDYIWRVGEPALYWCGVVEGMLKVGRKTVEEDELTFSGIPSGGWFGEGTVLKRGNYRFNAQALRASSVASLPVEDFHWLVARSIGFNRYLMGQLNERLGQLIAAREIERIADLEERIARHLAWLFNPVLFPGATLVLNITQQELAHLVGVSRQRVSQGLNALQARGMIRVEYGTISILDRPALMISNASR